MRRFKKGLAVSLALAVVLTSTIATTVMADNGTLSTILISKSGTDKGNGNGNTTGSIKKAEAEKDILEQAKDDIENRKDQLETQKGTLEEQYEAAKESGDTAKAEELKKQIDQLKAQMETTKQEMKQKKEEIKAQIKATYTAEELKAIDEATAKIKKNNKNVTVLPVESIIVKGVNVKFDTPPVIKSGRTLIPVKALSQAFGAEVQWIAAERKVVITKGDKEIVLTLDSNKIYVNGVQVTLDVPATSINGRTVVPLKFIVEQLGLKVNWDGDSKDIEIEDPTTPPTTTTGSAIVVTPSAIQVTP